MDSVSFQSRIRITDINTFNKEIRYAKKNFVDFPWTIKESVLNDKAATKDVFDCTVGGFTDGAQVLLTHICPTDPRNNSLNKIEKFITEKIDIGNSYLQGFILGSKNNNINSPDSPKYFDFFINFMKKFNIPFSYFRGGDYTNNVAYSSQKDEWLIGSSLLNFIDKKNLFKTPQNAIKRIFDEFKLCQNDELSW